MAEEAKKKKNYIGGSARQIIFPNNGSIISCFFKLEDLQNLPTTEKGYIRFDIAEMKEPDQYGNTHYAYENDWKPDGKKGGGKKSAPKKKAPPKTEEDGADDLPF